MAVSIVIQYQEDHPHSPGWWRFGRPRHEVRDQAPENSEHQRWHYGGYADAQHDAAKWDLSNPRG